MKKHMSAQHCSLTEIVVVSGDHCYGNSDRWDQSQTFFTFWKTLIYVHDGKDLNYLFICMICLIVTIIFKGYTQRKFF